MMPRRCRRRHKPDFFGHPRGLWYLAFTEAWERFSYYGMQSLLVLYMVKYLLLPGRIEHIAAFESVRRLYFGLEGQALASAIFGTYTAIVYFTPIFGGFLADRLLGRRRTVLLGALTMAAGHFLMAFEAAFLFALLCLILGCGMFKGNIASQVGSLYKPEDLRRADAFQIFYLGINAGVIASPLIVGTLGEKSTAGITASPRPGSACSSPPPSTSPVRNICAPETTTARRSPPRRAGETHRPRLARRHSR